VKNWLQGFDDETIGKELEKGGVLCSVISVSKRLKVKGAPR
jgi:hypothetical protein